MKLLFLSIILCVCCFAGNAQLSLPDTVSEGRSVDSGIVKKGIPDGTWKTWYKKGQVQFLRTYSFDKWQQFQQEKIRYHPKRISLPITQLFHENKQQAQKYLDAIHTFCAIQKCPGVNAKDEPEHYHPPFENGLLHGPFANYFPDGNLKDTGHYKNGLPEDLWTKWTDDRQFYWKGHYRHGKKNKEWKLYTANDKLISIVSFREGKFVWRKDMKEGVEIAAEELTGF